MYAALKKNKVILLKFGYLLSYMKCVVQKNGGKDKI